jgi:hypothetical protein
MKELQARVKELDKYGLWASAEDPSEKPSDLSVDVDLDEDDEDDDED